MTVHLLAVTKLEKALQCLRARFFARIDGAIALLLRGCWHAKMSWPIRLDGHAYRVCVGCGIKRLFDEETLACYGPYGYDLQQLAAEKALRTEWSRALVSGRLQQQRH